MSSHNPNASKLIDEAITKFDDPFKSICIRLRKIIHEVDPDIIEDWKWGPNFYDNGMVVNVWAFKDHASIVFFQGAVMKNNHKLFNDGLDNAKSRTIKFTNMNDLDDKLLKEYIKEAVEINRSGQQIKIKDIKKKKIEIPNDLQKLLKSKDLLGKF